MGISRASFRVSCLVAGLVAGCVSTGGVQNSNGVPLKFVRLYQPMDMIGGKFVLVELSPNGEAVSVAGIYSERPAEIKQNQELLAFDKGLTRYAVAIGDYSYLKYHDNTIPGTVATGTQEPYFGCPPTKPMKASGYNACSSNWFVPYLPYEYTVAYAKGNLPDFTWNKLKKEATYWRTSMDPKGVIERLGIVPLLEAQTVPRK